MKSKSEDINGMFFIPQLQPDCLNHINGNRCKVMIVDPDNEVQQIVKSALKHFSYSGKHFDIIGESNLKSATEICTNNPSLILILINRSEYDEHEVYQLIRYLRDSLNNSFCRIIFKDELVSYESLTNKFRLKGNNGNRTEFEEVRGNIISYLREVFISFEKRSTQKTNEIPKDVSKMINNDNELTKKKAFQKKGMSPERTYSVLAHDLRGPIGSIKTLLEVLTTEPELIDNETTQELLLNVKNTAGSIHEMLENFLFWVRVQKKDIHFSPMKIFLSQEVEKTMLLLNSSAYQKKIKLHSNIDGKIKVFADEYMLNTVLRNLILNAIKFTKEGGEVSIHAISLENEVEITVRDNGVGISEHQLTKINNNDTCSSKNGTADEKGMGFGLILSKDFIEKNGGQLLIESSVNMGSSFTFTVPIWKTMIAN